MKPLGQLITRLPRMILYVHSHQAVNNQPGQQRGGEHYNREGIYFPMITIARLTNYV